VIFDAHVPGRSLRVEVQEVAGRYHVSIDGRTLEVDYQDLGRGFASLLIDGRSREVGIERHAGGAWSVHLDGALHAFELHPAARGVKAGAAKSPAGPSKINAPMPGKIVRVLVEPGAQVDAGQGLIVMEAMKMENELRAPRAGRVQKIAVHEGQAVETGVLLVVLE
jgi:biotin carboxyl carrier protein